MIKLSFKDIEDLYINICDGKIQMNLYIQLFYYLGTQNKRKFTIHYC